jgi:hypothetical protein
VANASTNMANNTAKRWAGLGWRWLGEVKGSSPSGGIYPPFTAFRAPYRKAATTVFDLLYGFGKFTEAPLRKFSVGWLKSIGL